MTADGADEREGAEVAEITDLVDLSRWPEGTRAVVRREEPHPGAQLTFTDADGHCFQVFLTDLAEPDVAYLEALQRGRGRAEKRICVNVIGLVAIGFDPSATRRVAVTVLLFMAVVQVIVVTVDRRGARPSTPCEEGKAADDG